MLSRAEFKDQLYAAIHENTSVMHPLVSELVKPEKNLELLQALTLQGYQLTKNFLTYIEYLFFYCPLPKHKKALLVNMYEEETGRLSNTKNHVRLMEDFIRAIGISDSERDGAVAYPETQELIDYRMKLVKDTATYHLGAAAVAIASEGQNLEDTAGQNRHSLLGGVYGLSEKDTLFFSVHAKEDVGHVREGVALVVDLCNDPKMQQDALEVVTHTCKLFQGMYDGVAKRHLL
ncbi:TenA family transcriptional regulator [Nocardia camponoti]|uniref:Aldehyde dehydrogenase n=1 Tax=Nocardia camponoti TaxID=1616106 RepID=A0A917Q887_9NOCA|nr:iron-containing redox enzyme family protein [Nocardia camponoti]GGK34295.1 aldehyde dehydrogenase [Nocardia camponoti]